MFDCVDFWWNVAKPGDSIRNVPSYSFLDPRQNARNKPQPLRDGTALATLRPADLCAADQSIEYAHYDNRIVELTALPSSLIDGRLDVRQCRDSEGSFETRSQHGTDEHSIWSALILSSRVQCC